MEFFSIYRSMIKAKPLLSFIDRENFHSLPSNSVPLCEMGIIYAQFQKAKK